MQQTIVYGYSAGKTINDLARELGIHRTTVKAALEQHGVEQRTHSMQAGQISEAIRRYESGESLATIGEHLNFDAQTISTQLRKKGIQIRTPHEWR